MPNTTSRLGLVQPLGTDAVSELRVSITDNASTLDNSVIVTEGTLASRPAGSYNGQTYYATDTGLWYFYTGSAWETVMLAGGWQTLTPATGWVAYGAPGLQARVVGDKAELRGALQNQTGGTVTFATLVGSISGSIVPSTERFPTVSCSSGTAASLQVFPGPGSSSINILGSIANGDYVGFDGASYSLS